MKPPRHHLAYSLLLVLCCLPAGAAPVAAAEPAAETLTQKLAETHKRAEQLDRDTKASEELAKSLQPRLDKARENVTEANKALAAANTDLDKAKADAEANRKQLEAQGEASTPAKTDLQSKQTAADVAVKAKEDAVKKAKDTLATRVAERANAEKDFNEARTGADDDARKLAVAKADATTMEKQQQNALALDNGAIYTRSLAALTMLFVVAVLLESAFALLFNWKLFLTYFNARGMRTPIMFIMSLLMVNVFKLDVVANLIAIYKTAGLGELESDWTSKLVTALILAGGSAGVNNLMVALGYREGRGEAAPTRPPPDKAWLSFRAKLPAGVAPTRVKVDITEVANPAVMPDATAGIIAMRRARFWGVFVRDFKRFPQNEGCAVDANTVYHIRVWVPDDSNPPNARLTGLDGNFRFARGAIVDFDVTLR